MTLSPRFNSLVLDVDSTLCGVEGVDWLAARRGAEVARRTRELTDLAMNGEIALDSVYGERLELIRPTRAEVEALAQVYRETLAPGAASTIERLRDAGVRVVLVSGGLRQAIEPLASELGVELHAVDVYWDEAGGYAGFDARSPLTTSSGKLEIVRAMSMPPATLAVGDGATDLAMREAADEFGAYTGFVRREAIVGAADFELSSFQDLLARIL